jgi:hypothetical protein
MARQSGRHARRTPRPARAGRHARRTPRRPWPGPGRLGPPLLPLTAMLSLGFLVAAAGPLGPAQGGVAADLSSRADARGGAPTADRPPRAADRTGEAPAWVRTALRLNERYGCSPHGLADGAIPVRTVVRVAGEVRLASFDEGWAIHEGARPGRLLSVCAR